jgi:hypothetical protein
MQQHALARDVRTAARLVLGFVLGASVLSAPIGAQARSGSEPRVSCREVLEYLDGVDSWMHLYTAFKRFPRCDNTAVIEGWSEIVETLFSERWRTLPVLSRLVRRDPSFETFVLQHIDELWNDGAAEQLARNAHTQCPKGFAGLCGKLEKRARWILSQNADPVH